MLKCTIFGKKSYKILEIETEKHAQIHHLRALYYFTEWEL